MVTDPTPPEEIALVKTLDDDGDPLYRLLAEGELPQIGEIVAAKVVAFLGQLRQVELADGSIVIVDTQHGPDTVQRPPRPRRF